uniref:Protein-L-isoaspartate O-methyltransferase n=1 Tax=Panagrolaimus superbus TaxID=310955 RepID=A0A914YBH2_9BILA
MVNIFQKLFNIVFNKKIGYDYDEDWLDNQITIKKLKAAGNLRSPDIIAAFESINKAWFMPFKDEYDNSDINMEYKYAESDLLIHLFSPSIYSTILENLDLQQGHSFLNVGSGTGYLSSICGCLIGSKGKNIGFEIHPKLIDFAFTVREKLEAALASKIWCPPEFKCINIFDFKTDEKFDRIFIGASMMENQRTFICRMLKPFGIAILACDNKVCLMF